MDFRRSILARGWQVVGNAIPEREVGQGMVEYGMILVMVAIVCVAALTLMGPMVGSILSSVTTSL